ncbi:hypothetical protein LCGC14_1320550 [marine sediment metagenome]|uniref:Peptide chain release factor domain-containing protein n=1 Tax=marine sediment metagenome TaxID=412755 RepID=A0A0F9L4Z7_9ZZZZ
MRAETQTTVQAVEKSLALLRQRLDWETAPHRLEEFNAMVEDPDLWNDPDKAQKLMRDRQTLVDAMDRYREMAQELSDNLELIELGEAEEDAEVVTEAEAALKALRARAAEAEIEALLDGEADSNDTFLEINSGAGGTESCDWAAMLARMYVRWAEKKGYKVELQSESAGEEAGIKSAAYKITGHNAYGWLKSESGVHRLVRISPYDSAARRHTSFSSVWVYPVVDDNIEIEVNASDIRLDTYRSSGAGGQHDILSRQVFVTLVGFDRDLPLRRDRGFAHEDLDLVLLRQVFDPAFHLLGNTTRAFDHRLKIIVDLIHRQTKILGAVHQVEHFGRAQQRLGGNAAPVKANAAKVFPLYNRDLKAKLCAADSSDIAARPRTDHNQIKGFGSHGTDLALGFANIVYR